MYVWYGHLFNAVGLQYTCDRGINMIASNFNFWMGQQNEI